MDSIFKKKWKLLEQYPDEFSQIFSNEDGLILQLLYSRGIKTPAEAEKFFRPDYERDLYDPFLMTLMDKAADRIIRAISQNEKILIFGDYDADGVCGTAIFYDFLKKADFKNFEVYIPDRALEGHGAMSDELLESFSNAGVKLIVTIDCGASNYEEVLKARELGMDVIIVDHHSSRNRWPQAYAVLDSQKEDFVYPFKFLTGTGLAFKVASALVQKSDSLIPPGWEKWSLDIAAIGTIADLFPLRDENRALVYYGLQVLQKTRRIGLKVLFQKLRLVPAKITEDDVSFLIAPIINAGGRMDHASTSFILLTTDSLEEAEWAASRLVEKNNERKTLVESILSEVRARYENTSSPPPLIIAGKKEWQPGGLGAAGNKILEEFGRSAFLWGKGDSNVIRGSARGDGTVNLVELMKKMPPDFFEKFGGHPLAAAFVFKEEKIPFFESALNNAFFSLKDKETIETKNRYEVITYEKELSIDNLNWNFLKTIERFRPFGIENPKPIFILKNIIPDNIKTFGNGGLHLQLDFRKSSGEIVSAIGFFMSRKSMPKIKKRMPLDIAFSLERSNFKGYDELRMRIADLKTHEG